MKTIGMIGGMSWESSAVYYRLLNTLTRQRLGGHHSAKCLMLSVDFAEIEALQHAGDWQALTVRMIDAAKALERGGADFIIICTNTMHLMADSVADAVSIPLLHIADATANALRAAGHEKIGLLGTAFTMEQSFYRDRLSGYGLSVLVPDDDDRKIVHEIIYHELVHGRIEPASRQAYTEVIDRLAARGAGAVILGCTEIGLLVGEGDTDIPLFDTTRIHAEAAVDFALS